MNFKDVILGLALILALTGIFLPVKKDQSLEAVENRLNGLDTMVKNLDTFRMVTNQNFTVANRILNSQAKSDSVQVVYIQGLWNILQTPYENGIVPNYQERAQEVLTQINKKKDNEAQNEKK